ncbi:MAG: ATP-dependent helicase, partial [Chloroflexota bacterium]|nr:ATP-dependent helicase [Chloroflexota bacterium]
MIQDTAGPRVVLTGEQQRAVEWGEGPLMVLAGAGTGKTTVVVERVRHLLDADASLAPENILVLTYNVRAAGELAERLEAALGVERAGRIWVHNFHSFGYRLLRNHRDELGLAHGSDLLDQVGQRLLLRSLRPRLKDFVYHQVGRWPNAVDRFAEVISRAKDELVSPADYRAFAAGKRTAFDFRYGAGQYEEAVEALRRRQAEDRMWQVQYVRRELRNGTDAAARMADREARRDASGDGRATWWSQLTPAQQDIASGLKPTYLRDAEAFEVLKLEEEAEVYELYQAELQRRGQLDFGEQMSRTIQLLLDRPNIALRYQRQFRHVLVDEFQDANMAQIMLLELVARGPDKPDNVVVVGDDDQSIYRFRGASYAAFARFRERFGTPPVWATDRATPAVESLPLLQNRRSTANVLAAAGRLIEHNTGRLKEGQPLRPMKAAGDPVEVVYAADEADEADQIVERIRAAFESLPEPRRWGDIAVLYRRHAHRKEIVDRLRRAGIPYAVVGATGLFLQPEIRDVEAALRVMADPADSVSFTRLMTAGPWRFDASEILRLRKLADFDGRALFEAASEIRRDSAQDLETPLRLKLERLLGCLDDLVPRALREGPYTLIEEYLVRTNLLHDLIALETPDAQRQVLAVARLMRYAADWQRDHPRESLSDFVAYLDLYQEVGGDLDADGPASVQVEGVQLMTIYQAKGLEYEVVIVPRLIEGQFPDTRAEQQLIPVELLKQKPPDQ